MRAASHEVTLGSRRRAELCLLSPPRSSVALALRLAAFQPGVISASPFISRVIRSVCSSFGAHHAPVTVPATTFAHGRLRASHGVCLRCSTLEPAICARTETDSENLSTTENDLAESLLMQGDLLDILTASFGFSSTSRHCIPRLSPRNSNPNEVTANNALQRTAPAVTVAAILARASLVRSWRFLTSVASFFAPPSQLPRQPPRSLSLESLGVPRFH